MLLLGTAQSPEGAGRDWSVELHRNQLSRGKGPRNRRKGDLAS